MYNHLTISKLWFSMCKLWVCVSVQWLTSLVAVSSLGVQRTGLGVGWSAGPTSSLKSFLTSEKEEGESQLGAHSLKDTSSAISYVFMKPFVIQCCCMVEKDLTWLDGGHHGDKPTIGSLTTS